MYSLLRISLCQLVDSCKLRNYELAVVPRQSRRASRPESGGLQGSFEPALGAYTKRKSFCGRASEHLPNSHEHRPAFCIISAAPGPTL
jgi:hypothetical protein